MKRLVIAKNIATVATIISVVGILFTVLGSKMGDIFVLMGLALGFISYLFGGILTAIKMAWKIGVIGWYIIPIFPLDIAFFCFTFGWATTVFLFAPVIPIGKACRERFTQAEF